MASKNKDIKNIIEEDNIEKDKETLFSVIFNYRKNKQQFKPKEMLRLYSILKPKNLFDLQTYKFKFANKYHPLATFLINMELTNGKAMQFVIVVKDGGFIFDNGFYVVDEEIKYFNQTSGLYALDYHEELCFPVNKRINVKEIKDNVLNVGDYELENAINPKNVQQYIISDVIKKLLEGAELSKVLRKLMLMNIFELIGIVFLVLVNLRASGIL